MKLSLPDVTKAQLLAVLQAVVAAAVAFGAPLSQHQQDALLALATVLGTVLVAADVKIRGYRAQHIGSKLAAAAVANSGPLLSGTTGAQFVPVPDTDPAPAKKPATKAKPKP